MSVSWRMEKEKQGKENRIKNLGDFEMNLILFYSSGYLERWKSEKIENEQRMEKWEHGRDFNFLL